MRTQSQNEQLSQTPQEFAKDNWKGILAASGTLAGAAILLLIRYHKKKNKENGGKEDKHLLALEGEAEADKPDAVMFLDTALAVKEHIPDVDVIIADLEKGLPKKGESRYFMRMLRKIRK